jgi:thiol-disulfide isomerase/thioredoxin
MRPNITRAFALVLLLAVPLGTLRADPLAAGAAPAWSLKDPDGKTVTSDQFKGKVVVLDFWATWCTPCRAEIPGYIELQKKYAADGLVIVGVSMDQDGALVVRKFMANQGVNYTVVLGADSNIASDYGDISVIPTTFIIDRQGRIRDKKVGGVPTDEFEKRILAVLKPVAK